MRIGLHRSDARCDHCAPTRCRRVNADAQKTESGLKQDCAWDNKGRRDDNYWQQFGRMCRHITNASVAPANLAAATYSADLRITTSARTNLAHTSQEVKLNVKKTPKSPPDKLYSTATGLKKTVDAWFSCPLTIPAINIANKVSGKAYICQQSACTNCRPSHAYSLRSPQQRYRSEPLQG